MYFSTLMLNLVQCSKIGKIVHSSEKRRLYLMKSSSETLQNLPYFMYMKNKSCFFLFFISPNKCPGLCRHRSGAYIREKNKVVRNEKQKNQLCVFIYIKYGKFWSISLQLFIKQKHLFSEEYMLGFVSIY